MRNKAKINIVKNNYFMSDVILSSLKINNIIIHELINFQEDISINKCRKIRHLYYSRMKPVFLILWSRVKRMFVKEKSAAIYFGIEDYKGIACGIKNFGLCEKQVLWLWNPRQTLNISEVEFRFLVFILKLSGVSIWTFDRGDAQKYNLNFHEQVYSRDLVSSVRGCNKKNDVFFIGVDKGRLETLKKISSLLDDLSLIYSFNVVPDSHKDYSDKEPFISEKIFSYDEYLNLLSVTDVILEIVQNGQSGLTLRTLEAIFFNKKMITTNKNIIEYDFYNENNIFIYDENTCTVDKLSLFLGKPYHLIPESILDKYDINHLLNAMIKNI